MFKPYEFTDLLKLILNQELPGEAAQRKMLARPLTPIPDLFTTRPPVSAAVLLLLYPDDGQTRFILTKRTDNVETHKGQISLPGGTSNPGETAVKTALRETREEIGIDPDQVLILGELSPLHVKVSGFQITPIVGWLDNKPELVIEPAEVEDVFTIPLTDLLEDSNEEQEEWEIRGYPLSVPFFNFHPIRVWGATAMILAEFKQLIKQYS